MTGPGPSPAHYPPNVDEALRAFVLDFLDKHGFRGTAGAMRAESAGNPDLQIPALPVDTTDGPVAFLFQWFCVFWNLYANRTRAAFRKENARALQHQSTGAHAPQNQSSAWIGDQGNAAGARATQHQSTPQLNELRGPSSGSGSGGRANTSYVRHDFANQNQHLGLQQSVSQPQEYQAVHDLPRPGSSPPSSIPNANASGIKSFHAQMSTIPGYPHLSTPHDAHGHPYLPSVENPHQSNSVSPQQILHSNEQVGLQQNTPSYNGTGASPISQSNSLVNDPPCAPRYSPRINNQAGHNNIAGNSRDARSTCIQFPSRGANSESKADELHNSLSQEPTRSPASAGEGYNQHPKSTQRGKRQRVDHVSSSPRHESGTVPSSPVIVGEQRHLESAPGRSVSQHTENSGERVCQGTSSQMSAGHRLPRAHMQDIEISRETRDYEQESQDGESKDLLKLRTTERFGDGDISLQQRTLMFRAPAESNIIRNAKQNPQSSVKAADGTSEDLTHVLSPSGGQRGSSSDKSQLKPQTQLAVREHNTPRSRQEDRHNPRNSTTNLKVQQLAEIGQNDCQGSTAPPSQEQHSAGQKANGFVAPQDNPTSTREHTQHLSQGSKVKVQSRQDHNDHCPHAPVDTEHSSHDGSHERAEPSRTSSPQNTRPVSSTTIMNEVGNQGASTRNGHGKVGNVDPAANAVAVAASSLPAGTFIVHMTSSGFVYMHDNVYRIWPSGQVIQMPSTSRSAAGANPQISSVTRRRRPPPFHNSAKCTDASDVAEFPIATGNNDHGQYSRPLLENAANADMSGSRAVPVDGPRRSLSENSVEMRTAETRATGTVRSLGLRQISPVFNRCIDGPHDRGTLKSGLNTSSPALDIHEKDFIPMDTSDEKTEAWTNSRDRAYGPNEEDDGSVKSSRHGSLEPCRPGSGTPSQRSNASGGSVGRRGRGSGGGGKGSRGRGRGRGRDPPRRNTTAPVREGNELRNSVGRGRLTVGSTGDSGDVQQNQERKDAQQEDQLPAVRTPSVADASAGADQGPIGQTLPAASNGSVSRDVAFQFGTTNISSAPADVLPGYVEYGAEDRLGGGGPGEHHLENNCSVGVVENGEVENAFGKASGNRAALVRDENGLSKLTSAVGFGYADEFQTYLNCGPDDENVLGNILDMNNINRINGGLSHGADGYEDDAGILGGGDPDDNFDLGTGRDN